MRRFLEKNILSSIIYFTGMSAFFFADILIAKKCSVDVVSHWAFLKSILFISSTVAIFGLDQSIIRHPGGFNGIAKQLVLQVVALSIGLSVCFCIVRSDLNLFILSLQICLTALLTLLFAVQRGALLFNRAQTSLNGWKFVFLLILIFLPVKADSKFIDLSLIAALFATLIAMVLLDLINRKAIDYYLEKSRTDPVNKKTMTRDGLLFVVLSVSLTFSVNFEQLLLNMNQKTLESSLLFAHMSVFLPPVVFMNGFVGFMLGPVVRENREASLHAFNKYLKIFILTGFILVVLSYFLGLFSFNYIYKGKYLLSPVIALLILGIAFFRFIYALPSAFVGVIGHRIALKKFAAQNLIATILSPALYFAFFLIFNDAILAILLASLINWGVRAVGGIMLVEIKTA